MRNYLGNSVFLVLCLTMVSSLGAWAVTYPDAELTSYDAATYTYTYTVSLSSGDSYPFGHFRIYAEVPNAGDTGGWITNGPTVNGNVVPGWSTIIGQWESAPDQKDYVAWQASSAAEVPRATNWVGLFTLVAPNTSPVSGWLYTSDGPGSAHTVEGLVPGPTVPAGSVPEPSGLFGVVCGMTAFLGLRRTKLNRD